MTTSYLWNCVNDCGRNCIVHMYCNNDFFALWFINLSSSRLIGLNVIFFDNSIDSYSHLHHLLLLQQIWFVLFSFGSCASFNNIEATLNFLKYCSLTPWSTKTNVVPIRMHVLFQTVAKDDVVDSLRKLLDRHCFIVFIAYELDWDQLIPTSQQLFKNDENNSSLCSRHFFSAT